MDINVKGLFSVRQSWWTIYRPRRLWLKISGVFHDLIDRGEHKTLLDDSSTKEDWYARTEHVSVACVST